MKGQEAKTIIIRTNDGKDMSISGAKLPLTIIYEYNGEQRLYTLKATKNDKLLMN